MQRSRDIGTEEKLLDLAPGSLLLTRWRKIPWETWGETRRQQVKE